MRWLLLGNVKGSHLRWYWSFASSINFCHRRLELLLKTMDWKCSCSTHRCVCVFDLEYWSNYVTQQYGVLCRVRLLLKLIWKAHCRYHYVRLTNNTRFGLLTFLIHSYRNCIILVSSFQLSQLGPLVFLQLSFFNNNDVQFLISEAHADLIWKVQLNLKVLWILMINKVFVDEFKEFRSPYD